jgi:putative heme-binding domain-containing protein
MSILTVINSPLAKDKWKEEAKKIVDTNPREVGFFQAITELKLTDFDQQIAVGLASDNRKVIEAAELAKAATTNTASSGKKVAELAMKDVFSAAMAGTGNADTGKRLFTSQGCVACHATELTAEQKGPYLGAAGAKFTRDYLIDSILDPNKVVAQGFQTFVFTLNDGSTHIGFITSEADGVIELRNIAGQISQIKRGDVKKEDHLPTSMMPPGLTHNLSVDDFISLIDYLTTLKAKGG